MPMARWAAGRGSRGPRAAHADDLLGEAFLGLVEGVSRWDPGRGPLEAAAFLWARQRVGMEGRRLTRRREHPWASEGERLAMEQHAGPAADLDVALDADGLARRVIEVLARHIHQRRKSTPRKRAREAAGIFIRVKLMGMRTLRQEAKARGVTYQSVHMTCQRVAEVWPFAAAELRDEESP